MKSLICDVCKHRIVQLTAGVDYVHVAHRDLCESCKKDLDRVVQPVIRTNAPFQFAWYNRFVQDAIEEAVQKGAFDAGV